ncbi:MAG: 1-deoxy-D-xylulose-5-phosphate reductoisomerase, partial [Planctomycetota bacterium]
MKKIVILGSTGSIGRQALEVVREHPSRLQVAALAAGANGRLLAEQASEFAPKIICLADGPAPPSGSIPPSTMMLEGADELPRLVEESDADLVLNAITGAAGLAANLRAVELGRDLAIANKESLVMAGELLQGIASGSGSRILPIDSEHSAIHQCLRAGSRGEVRRIILTASGGPFRGRSREELGDVTPREALRHPTWKMGPKITVDSATLMNKALEVIEARVLFGLSPEQIEVVVHPQSVVHSLVEFHDGSLMAHLGEPDMRVPIQYALSYPDRWQRSGKRWSPGEGKVLEFEALDHETFPSVRMAYRACREGGTLPVVLNGANERAVELFLEGRIAFLDIFDLVERALETHDGEPSVDLETL